MGGEQTRDYWTYWLQQMTVTNGAGGAGDHTYSIAGASGGESVFDIFEADLTNGDTVARNVSVVVDALTTTALTILPATSLNAGATVRLPFLGQVFAATGNNPNLTFPYHMGPARMLFTLAAVALSENSTFGILLRFKGRPPTIASNGAATPTLATNVNLNWVVP